MPMVFIESELEFIQRHGGDVFAGLKVQIGPGHWLLSTGATIIQGGSNNPVFQEPPDNPRQRLELRRRYHAHRATLFEQAFHAMKNALMGAGIAFSWHHDFGPDPGGDGKPALIQLKNLAADQRRKLAALDKEIFDLPENVERRERERLDREWREREERIRQEKLSEIQQICLDPTETIQP